MLGRDKMGLQRSESESYEKKQRCVKRFAILNFYSQSESSVLSRFVSDSNFFLELTVIHNIIFECGPRPDIHP